jgi:hypothetical protein
MSGGCEKRPIEPTTEAPLMAVETAMRGLMVPRDFSVLLSVVPPGLKPS